MNATVQQGASEPALGDGRLWILHLGLGSFHRAHQAVYLNELHKAEDRRWALAGGNLRPDMVDVVDGLIAQGGAYTLETVTPQGERSYERIGSIQRVVRYQDDLRELKEIAADPATRIISFTVTEAGYYLDLNHRLDPAFADVRADLADRNSHRTLYASLAMLLEARRQAGAGRITLQNCDNLRSNGERFREGFLEFLTLRGDTDLRDWVRQNTTTPDSMVDRITPRPPADLKARIQQKTGFADQAPVMGETFIQWVIEDDFCNGRPEWEKVGAEMVDSVLPYEEAKIRILNATHSCVAWAGSLLGMQFIHESTQHPPIHALARAYVTDDVIPCLTPSPLDLERYRDVVLERFSNPYIQDTNQRVAMDGFSKLPGMIVPTIRQRYEAGQPFESVAVLPALFFAFLRRWNEGRIPFEYQDAAMDPATTKAFFGSADPLKAFCDDRTLWGPLAGNEQVRAAIARGLDKVRSALGDAAVA